MSKLIRSSTVVSRPVTKRDVRPVYLIASGGEVFLLKRMAGAATWVAANEADFSAKADPAANEPAFCPL